jgi:hypothetical protein
MYVPASLTGWFGGFALICVGDARDKEAKLLRLAEKAEAAAGINGL